MRTLNWNSYQCNHHLGTKTINQQRKQYDEPKAQHTHKKAKTSHQSDYENIYQHLYIHPTNTNEGGDGRQLCMMAQAQLLYRYFLQHL